jgi:8-oxo-dGTP pyrophosphatase MutT (NUDIX family)
MPKPTYKTSYGIALCRYNHAKNKQFEILLIKKRYTYYYFSFVFGYYKKYNTKHLQYLFDNMTFGEKIDILSMDFSKMWYKLWMFDPAKKYNVRSNYDPQQSYINSRADCYFKKKAKFESTFLRDGGTRLKRLINNSTNSSTIWEIPKGARDGNENDLSCAIREFNEESGIKPDNYYVLWDVKPLIFSHIDENIVYRSVYYLSYLDKNSVWEPKVNFVTSSQISEVEEIKWVSLQEINFLNVNVITKKKLCAMYKKILHQFKKHIKSIYYV